jgi:hypothetical protein
MSLSLKLQTLENWLQFNHFMTHPQFNGNSFKLLMWQNYFQKLKFSQAALVNSSINIDMTS